jgi:predicted DNA-binding transcriptional regulator YafY
MSESTTTSRVLALLNLLQTHRHWPGPELARRLAVTDRTLRRDIERLRDLGYRVESVPGASGGYRLEAGAALPPLLLTDDEAVTMAIGLRLAATQGLEDGEHTTLTALAKLEQVLPSALRRRVNALAATVQSSQVAGTSVSPEVLGVLALACRDRERLRFDYVSADGTQSQRSADPHSLVSGGRSWFLVAWDLRREDWRTFRVDRMSRVLGTRVVGPERVLPAESGEFVRVAMNSAPTRLQAAVIMDLPLHDMQDRFGPWAKFATAETPTTTRWPIGGDGFQDMLFALSWIPEGVGYRIEGNEEFAAWVREAGERMTGV